MKYTIMFVQNMKDKKCKTYEQVCLLYVDQFILNQFKL